MGKYREIHLAIENGYLTEKEGEEIIKFEQEKDDVKEA